MTQYLHIESFGDKITKEKMEMLTCEGCGKEFDATNAELHELEQTQVEIGCPDCSFAHTYHRNEGDC